MEVGEGRKEWSGKVGLGVISIKVILKAVEFEVTWEASWPSSDLILSFPFLAYVILRPSCNLTCQIQFSCSKQQLMFAQYSGNYLMLMSNEMKFRIHA